jgi:hypothetical protein
MFLGDVGGLQSGLKLIFSLFLMFYPSIYANSFFVSILFNQNTFHQTSKTKSNDKYKQQNLN